MEYSQEVATILVVFNM